MTFASSRGVSTASVRRICFHSVGRIISDASRRRVSISLSGKKNAKNIAIFFMATSVEEEALSRRGVANCRVLPARAHPCDEGIVTEFFGTRGSKLYVVNILKSRDETSPRAAARSSNSLRSRRAVHHFVCIVIMHILHFASAIAETADREVVSETEINHPVPPVIAAPPLRCSRSIRDESQPRA